jgi:hypothetical protein
MREDSTTEKAQEKKVRTTEQGTLRTWSEARGVFVIQFSGHLTSPLAHHLMTDTNMKIAQHAPIYIFNDWSGMKSYDSDARTDLTTWAARIKPRLLGVHLLVSSKLVSMGISVANLALGGFLQAHAERTSWDAALRHALKLSP